MIVEAKRIINVTLLDLLLIIGVVLIPTISHVLPIPLYLLEPIRLMVLCSLLFFNDKRNAFFLAILLPLTSFIVTGHPVLIKMILMSAEFIVNVTLLSLMYKKINIFFSVFLSTIVSKSVYYLVKYLLVSLGLINMELLSTPIYIQLCTITGLSVIFSCFYDKKRI